ncbi:MAG: type II toxin-antitoxin system prevent-host-death family antitoxin [Gammaproteobacteria bacterium]|nr:type II toxin-antitoxin system prevent-host-death family antitoxin [Gammaproteobacteria bacterium]
MSRITNISEAKASLSKLIERVEKGERVIIGRAGKPVAILTAWEPNHEPRSLGGSWEGQVWVADDFDELPEELAHAFGVNEPF